MAIGPMGVGDTLPAWNFTILVGQTNTPLDLTGATVTLTVRDQAGGRVTAGAGVLVLTNAAAGQGQYQWAAADLPYTGTFKLRLKITYPSGQETAAEEVVTVF